MKFYDRETEVKTLRTIESLSDSVAQMTVITGRRRIGKTTLVKHAFTAKPFIYFFVARKSEVMLCEELTGIVRETLGEDLGDFTSFSRLFRVLMNLSRRISFTLVFDEFQNLKYANEALFSEIQHTWDDCKEEAHINLVICGSVYSLMTKIFDDAAEPLYGRATHRFNLQPFPISTLKTILRDGHSDYAPDDLLTLYMLTGGVAKYVEQLVMHGCYTSNEMIGCVLSHASYFINEGYEMLREEFGREYSNYFSVLQAIADGHTERGGIKSATGIEPGGYLDKLEKQYHIVRRQRPFLQPEGTRNIRYYIADNFLTFWFRFVYKYRSAIEIGNLDYVKGKALADYETFSGIMLERFFRQLFAETGQFSIVTNYWKGGGDEIDLVAVDEGGKRLVIAECKRQARRISVDLLKEKARDIVARHRRWTIVFRALSLSDMQTENIGDDHSE